MQYLDKLAFNSPLKNWKHNAFLVELELYLTNIHYTNVYMYFLGS